MTAADWHPEVLTPDQRRALDAMAEPLAVCGAALGGGLAVALRFGHRRSQDLDWFTPDGFDPQDVARRLAAIGAEVTHAEPGTVHATLMGVPLSLIRWRYRFASETGMGVPVADQRTLHGMKALAAVNRGAKRDLIDLAEMLRTGTDLARLLEEAVQDVTGLTPDSILRALAYHADAERDPAPEGTDESDWEAAKELLLSEVRRHVAGG